MKWHKMVNKTPYLDQVDSNPAEEELYIESVKWYDSTVLENNSLEKDYHGRN